MQSNIFATKIYNLRIKNTIRLDIEKVLYRLFFKKIFT